MNEKDLLCLSQVEDLFRNQKGKLQNPGYYTEASVFLPLVETEEGVGILFEERSSELSWQPGEISLPGGRIEPEDLSPVEAALRETCEELGLRRNDLELYGEMDYFVSHLGLVIYPSVGRILHPENIVPQKSEVARTFTVPLNWFLKTKPRTGKIDVATQPQPGFPFDLLPPTFNRGWRTRTHYEVEFYPYREWVIWGLTAQVIKGFLNILRRENKG